MSDDNKTEIGARVTTPISDRSTDNNITTENSTVSSLSDGESDAATYRFSYSPRFSENTSGIFNLSDRPNTRFDPLGLSKSTLEFTRFDPYGVKPSEGYEILSSGMSVATIPFPPILFDGCVATPAVVTAGDFGSARPMPDLDGSVFRPAASDILKPTTIFNGSTYNVAQGTRNATYIDTNLIRNSNDNFRNFLKSQYFLQIKEGGPAVDFIQQYKYIFDDMPTRDSSVGVKDYLGTDRTSARKVTVLNQPRDAEFTPRLESISLPYYNGKVHNKGLLTLRTPFLLAAPPQEYLVNDEDWRRFIVGGIFEGKEYPGILTKGFGEETVFQCALPMELQNAKESIKDKVDSTRSGHLSEIKERLDTIEFKSVTNYSLPMYENYLDLIENSLLIPNYYHSMFHNQELIDNKPVPPRPDFIKNYYSMKNKFRGMSNLMEVTTIYPPPEEFKKDDIEIVDAFLGDFLYIDRNVTFKKYLNTFTKTNFAPKIKDRIIRRNTTYLFPFGISNKLSNENKKYLPYYNIISIPNRNQYFYPRPIALGAVGKSKAKSELPDGDARLCNIFNSFINNQASILFANMLKKHFVEQDVLNDLPRKNYAVSTETPYSLTPDLKYNHQVSNESLKYIDLYDSLVDEYEQEITDVGVSSLGSHLPTKDTLKFSKFYFESIAINSLDQDYRLYKTVPILKLLNNIVGLANSDFLYWKNVSPFPPPGGKDITLFHVLDYLRSPKYPRYSETIGYRIEKIEVNKLNQQRKSSSIQNIIILKNQEGKEPELSKYIPYNIQYVDTQIKKGTPYEYNVYEYKIVVGYKYKISNPLVTKKIDKPSYGKDKKSVFEFLADPSLLFCLEFYNPYTLDAGPSIFTTLKEYEEETAPYFTKAQIITPHAYLAQLTLDIEPVYRIYEIPIATKEVTNTDHPPHPLEVTPYQRKDDSQVIGFHLLKENFTDYPFPIGTNEEEEQIIQKYLNSQNLVEGEKIINESKSKSRFIQIYRIDKKPTSLKDFNKSLVATKDLKITTNKINLSVATDCFYEEKIKTNTKLYYTFRVISEEGVIGAFSPVFETELIDDGNYKYAKFTKHEIRELKEKRVYNEPGRNLKKLMQLIPSANQTSLNSDNIDFNRSASEQLDNMIVGTDNSPIWGKEFKIRLTSKKTGKKIDLNVTYRLRK